MAEDEKIYANFTVKKVQDKEREEYVEKVKAQFSLDQIVSMINSPTTPENITTPDELNEFKKSLSRELTAIDKADKAAPGNKTAAYTEPDKDRNKNPIKDTGGESPIFKDYYAAEDDYEKNYKTLCNEYSEEFDSRLQTALEDLRREMKANNASDQECEEATLSDVKIDEIQKELFDQYPDYKTAYDKASELVHLRAEHDERRQVLEAIDKLPANTKENLIKFYNDCQADDVKNDPVFANAFYQTFADYLSNPSFQTSTKKDGTVVNRHEFSLTNIQDKDGTPHKTVRHAVYNLNDTGLDICIVNGKIGFTHGKPQLTEEQVRALSEYCYYNGFEITDYQKLAEMDVVDKTGKSVGKANEEMQHHFEELRTGDKVGRYQAVVDDVYAKDDAFAEFLPKLKPIDSSRATMLPAAEKAIEKMGFSNPNLRRITYGWNSTIISVYGNENDILVDGKLDKNGKRQHTKKFAVELSHTFPPSARFYFEYGTKINADLVRVALDAFKASGSQYFLVDNVLLSGGKEMGGSIMKASVKTKMVPVLKDSPNGQGGDVGKADLKTVLEELPKEEYPADESAEYQMRWYNQLKKYMDGNPGKVKEISPFAEKFKYGARFAVFTDSHKKTLMDHITAGLNGKLDGKQWDSVDQITSLEAMNDIIKEIEEGKLNGKPYNPLDTENSNKIIQVLENKMTEKRADVELSVKTHMDKKFPTDSSTDQWDEIRKQRYEKELESYTKSLVSNRKENLTNTCNSLESYGVQIKISPVSATKTWDPREQADSKKENAHNINRSHLPLPNTRGGR